MKQTIFKLSIYALLLYALPLYATRYHVNINSGDDAKDGLKWSTAFKNLQPALDLIKDGDEIWIAAGVYHPTKKIAEVYGSSGHETRPTTDRHRSFMIKKNVKIYGGFSKTPSDATGLSSRNWRNNHTVLSGDFNNDDGYDFENMKENAFHVVILFDASPAMLLDGLYITGGCADDIANTYTGETEETLRVYYVSGKDGGGIYAYSPSKISSPTLSDVSLYGNFAYAAGGGLFNFSYANDASPRLENVSIVHNKALNRHGGGLYNNGGFSVYAELVNVNIVGNESTLSGGGMYFFGIVECSPVIINTVVNGNYADYGNGGGIYMSTFSHDCEPVIVNTTICGNRVAKNPLKDGGGLVVYPLGLSRANIHNTVIWGNQGNMLDNFFAEGDEGNANIITGSLIQGYNDSEPTNLPGNTNPKFLEPVSAAMAPTIDGDYQLTLESPLIDKGLNASISISNDLLGNPRINNGKVDIGAYESQGIPPVFNETFSEKAIWSDKGILYIRIHQPASIHVYNLGGALVKHEKALGEGMVAYPLPRGIYIVTLSNGIVEKVIIQ